MSRSIPHARDLLGRKIPRPVPIAACLLIIAHIDPTRVREVPRSSVVEEGFDEADGLYALLTCPCGGQPICGMTLEKCAGCERYYVVVAVGNVCVVYGAMTPPPLIDGRSLVN